LYSEIFHVRKKRGSMSTLVKICIELAIQLLGERIVARVFNEVRYWFYTMASQSFRAKADEDYFKMITDWDPYKSDRDQN
jgi:hypothetical protein